MTDIIYGERLKKVFRMLLKLGYKTLKKDMDMISQDLDYNQNPVIRNLNAILKLGAYNLHQQDDYQRNETLKYGQAGLWIVTKDTAYRDMFFWTFDKILEHADEFRKLLKPYVKPPEEWIPNLWQASKDKTKELKKKKLIPDDDQSFEETMFTPQIQDKRHKKLLNKK